MAEPASRFVYDRATIDFRKRELSITRHPVRVKQHACILNTSETANAPYYNVLSRLSGENCSRTQKGTVQVFGEYIMCAIKKY